jgi:hypothetical protein
MRILAGFLFCCLSLLAAIKNFTGYETGTNAECQGQTSGTFSIQATTKHTGGYALRVNPTTTANGYCMLPGIGATGALATSTGKLYARGWIYPHTVPAANDDEILYVRTGSGHNIFFIRMDSGRHLCAYDYGAGTPTQLACGTTALTLDAWAQIGFSFTPGANQAWEVNIAGAAEISGSTDDFDLAGSSWYGVTLGKGTDRNGNSLDIYYDDWYIADTAYATNDAASRAVLLTVTGNGNYTQFNSGTNGSDYQEVDDPAGALETATYVQAAAGGELASYALQNTATVSITTGTIRAAKVMTYVQDVTAGASYQQFTRTGTTDSYVTAADPGASWVWRFQIWPTIPGTSNAWTTAAIDGMEGGVKDNSGANRIRCSTVYGAVWWDTTATASGRRSVRVTQW